MKKFTLFILGFFTILSVLTFYIFGGAFIFAYPITLLWNYTMIKFGLPVIGYWDGFCLYLLFNILLTKVTPKGDEKN